MRVAVFTEPPTVLLRPTRRKPYFGGTYHRIPSVRRILEDQGHEVRIYIVFQGNRIVPEKEVYEFAIAQTRFHSADVAGGQPALSLLEREEFGALVIALNARNLVDFVTTILRGLSVARHKPVVFVNAGPATASLISRIASQYGTEVRILNKPGVVRITKNGMEEILSSIR